jgi:hypothetical protein
VTTTKSTRHTYKFTGDYTLTVWADDQTGITTPPHNVSDAGDITVIPPTTNHAPAMLTSGFTVSNANPWVGQLVTFYATPTDSDNDILDVTIDFGDGTTYTVTQGDVNATVIVTHSYSTASDFFPSVTFTDTIAAAVTKYSTDMVPMWWVTTQVPSFDLNLLAGWNFVSLPFVGYGYMASMLDLGPGDLVVGYNPLIQDYDQTYFWDFAEVDFALEDSCGYWIYSSVANTLTIQGSYPSVLQSMNIDVPDAYGGWAAVGFTGLDTTRWASDIVGMYTGGIDLVVEWDPTIQDYSNTYFAMWNEGDFQLSPGMCYWVYFLGDGTLTYLP